MNKNLYRGRIVGARTGIYALDWVFGDFVQELSTGRTFIIDLAEFDDTTLLKDVLVEVESSSVGQCSGVFDTDGYPIFEGDLVKYTSMNPGDGNDFVGVIRFESGGFVAVGKEEAQDLNVDNWYNFKVFANKTDSPHMFGWELKEQQQ